MKLNRLQSIFAFRWFVLGYFAILASCVSHNIQTSSGKAYLSKYPPQNQWQVSEDLVDKDLDAQVAKVAAIEPVLRFPARIGIT